MRDIVVLAHNIRSTHNVGALFRTSEFLGVSSIILSGYTPYPLHPHDTRLPHESRKITSQIHKTALGTEEMLKWQHCDSWQESILQLKNDGYEIIALEQDSGAVSIANYSPAKKVCIVLGEEVEGIEANLLNSADVIVEIPRIGKKESLNVVQAAAVLLSCIQICKN